MAVPGETIIVWPWERVYRFDTSVQYVSWGARGSGTFEEHDDYVYTRAVDGNEVALAVTIQYHIDPEKGSLRNLVQHVGTSNERVRKLVEAVARADIRTYMNELQTKDFFNRDRRYQGIERVKSSMVERLEPMGIVIDSVILNEHRFERLLPSAAIDRSYQEKIDETQKLGQDTERELLRIETEKARKRRELNDMQARVNREVAEAEGYIEQARFRGNGYFEAKQNEAKAFRARGEKEIEALVEPIGALRGKGGRALLKLELAKALIENDAGFVLMNESESGSGLGLRKVDTNELLRQIGVVEGLGTTPRKPRAGAANKASGSSGDLESSTSNNKAQG